MQAPNPTALVREIRAEMARQAVTRDTLSSATDMSRSALSRRLSGSTDLTMTEAWRIAAALGVSLDELIRRASEQAVGAA